MSDMSNTSNALTNEELEELNNAASVENGRDESSSSSGESSSSGDTDVSAQVEAIRAECLANIARINPALSPEEKEEMTKSLKDGRDARIALLRNAGNGNRSNGASFTVPDLKEALKGPVPTLGKTIAALKSQLTAAEKATNKDDEAIKKFRKELVAFVVGTVFYAMCWLHDREALADLGTKEDEVVTLDPADKDASHKDATKAHVQSLLNCNIKFLRKYANPTEVVRILRENLLLLSNIDLRIELTCYVRKVFGVCTTKFADTLAQMLVLMVTCVNNCTRLITGYDASLGIAVADLVARLKSINVRAHSDPETLFKNVHSILSYLWSVYPKPLAPQLVQLESWLKDTAETLKGPVARLEVNVSNGPKEFVNHVQGMMVAVLAKDKEPRKPKAADSSEKAADSSEKAASDPGLSQDQVNAGDPPAPKPETTASSLGKEQRGRATDTPTKRRCTRSTRAK